MSLSSKSPPSKRPSIPSDSLPNSHPALSDPFNTPLCNPIPEPYLLNPLTIGPLDSSSIEENDATYHRRQFFHTLNKASKQSRPASYDASAFGWLPIYWNAGWAAWLRELGYRREEDALLQSPSQEIRSGAEESEFDEDDAVLERKSRIFAEVQEDAREFVPDTDLAAPLQEILKEMYWEYIVEEEVRRRVARLESLRRRRTQMDRQASIGERCPAILVAASEVKRTRGLRGRVPRMPEAVDLERGVERMVEQLTTFAEYLDEEGC